MSLSERPWRRVVAGVGAVTLLSVSLLIAAYPRGFERLFLRTAGKVIGGFSDHLGVWIAVSVAAGVLGWTVLAIACWRQQRRERPRNEI